MAFWGKVLKANSKTEVDVPEIAGLVITQVTLPKESKGTVSVVLRMEYDEEHPEDDRIPPVNVAHLEWGKRDQASLELTFSPGDSLSFEVKGNSDVHVLGFLSLIPGDSGEELDSDEFGDSDSDEAIGADELMHMDSDDSGDDEDDEDGDASAIAAYMAAKAGLKKNGGRFQEMDSDDDSDEEEAKPKQNSKKRALEESPVAANKKPKNAEAKATPAAAKPATPKPAAKPTQAKPTTPTKAPESPASADGSAKKKRKRNKKNKAGQQ